MINQEINLTEICTIKELQYILQKSEEFKGNVILEDSTYRKQIIKYVLSHLNHRYTKIENLTEIPKNSSDVIPHCPINEQIAIRQLIQIKMSEIVGQLLKQAQIEKYSHKVGELK